MVEAGYTHAWLFQTPVIDCPKMLMHMLEEIKASPYADDIDVKQISTTKQLKRWYNTQ